jgi:hypothetical protein
MDRDKGWMAMEGKPLFNPHHCREWLGFGDNEGLVEGLIPAVRIGDRLGLYHVTAIYRPKSPWHDPAPWDDGKEIDLRLVRVIDLPIESVEVSP